MNIFIPIAENRFPKATDTSLLTLKNILEKKLESKPKLDLACTVTLNIVGKRGLILTS